MKFSFLYANTTHYVINMDTNMINVFHSIFSYSTCANNNKMDKDVHWSNAWLEAVDDNKVVKAR